MQNERQFYLRLKILKISEDKIRKVVIICQKYFQKQTNLSVKNKLNQIKGANTGGVYIKNAGETLVGLISNMREKHWSVYINYEGETLVGLYQI